MELRPVIVLPTYNNQQTVFKIAANCSRCSHLPMIIVDDGSRPGLDLKDFQDISTNLILLKNNSNQGKGFSLNRAFKKAIELGYTHVLVLDADGQHNPRDIVKFENALAQNPFSLISGYRNFEQSTVPSRSKFGRKNSDFWVWFHTGYRMKDSQSGFRIYPLFGFQTLKITSKRYEFEVELAVKWLWKFQVSPIEVQIDVVYNKDIVSHFRKFKDSFRASWMHFCLAYQTFFLPLWIFKKIFKTLVVGPQPWSGKLRGGKWGNLFLAFLASHAPRPFLEILLKFFVVPYFLVFAQTARKALSEFRGQLSKASPDKLNVKKRRTSQLAFDYRQFQSFASVLMDRLVLSRKPKLDLIIDQSESGAATTLFLSKQKGAVIVSGHFGSLEIIGHVYSESVGTRKIHAMEYVALDGLAPKDILGARQAPTDLLEIRAQLKEKNDFFCFLPDRPSQSQFELLPFMNGLVYIDVLPFKLALLSDVPILALFAVKVGPQSYKIFAKQLSVSGESGQSSAVTLMRSYLKYYEGLVLRHPEAWFNFYTFFSHLPHSPKGPLWSKVKGNISRV